MNHYQSLPQKTESGQNLYLEPRTFPNVPNTPRIAENVDLDLCGAQCTAISFTIYCDASRGNAWQAALSPS